MNFLYEAFAISLLVQACVSVSLYLEGGKRKEANKRINKGKSVTLTCNASPTKSGGDSNLEWMYDTVPDAAGTHLVYQGSVVVDSTRISIRSPYSLVIADIVLTDAGYYTCRVTIPGDVPSADSGTYLLTVLVEPHWDILCGSPGDQIVALGDFASFQCKEVEIQAVPSPTFRWYKDGDLLPLTSANNPMYEKSSFSYNPQTGLLTLRSVTDHDLGTYYCEATNEAGSSKCQPMEVRTKKDDEEDEEKKESDAGPTVGIMFGIFFALILIGVLIWWFRQR